MPGRILTAFRWSRSIYWMKRTAPGRCAPDGATHLFTAPGRTRRTGKTWLSRTSPCCVIWSASSKNGTFADGKPDAGYKVYGAHLGPFKTPARESDPVVPGAEFNAAQLAWLSQFQRGKRWHWNAIRPGVVGSAVPGNAMNLALSIALYASPVQGAGFTVAFSRFGTDRTVSLTIPTPGCWPRQRCGPPRHLRHRIRRST